MSEDAIVILVMLFWATAAYAVYLRLFVVRRLQKRVDSLVDSALAAATAAPASLPASQPIPAVEQLKKRVQVLERIATDGNQSLDRDLEALRDR